MVKISESALKIVIYDKRKGLIRLNQKVLEVGRVIELVASFPDWPNILSYLKITFFRNDLRTLQIRPLHHACTSQKARHDADSRATV